jgi:hypothetical protein
VLRNGGGLATAADNDDDQIITAEQEMARLQIVNYVGKRSGKRLFNGNGSGAGSSGKQRSIDDTTVLLHWRIKVAELLYIIRPLLYTEWQGSSQQQSSSNFNTSPWAVALFMDLASLWGLRPVVVGRDTNNNSGRRHQTNVASRREVERRQMRLLLYLLRSPVWDWYTEPLAQRVGSSLQKSIPLFGNLLQCYFWDWLYHWKEYRLDEG